MRVRQFAVTKKPRTMPGPQYPICYFSYKTATYRLPEGTTLVLWITE
jgi:hypothetical protein